MERAQEAVFEALASGCAAAEICCGVACYFYGVGNLFEFTDNGRKNADEAWDAEEDGV